MLFKSLKNIDYIESTVEKVSKKQANLSNPSPVKENRDEFWNLYYSNGFKTICKKYFESNFKTKIKTKIKKIIKR
jgi:hypothetical protein